MNNKDIQSWLLSLHSATWGRGFSITSQDDIDAAANWFADQITSLTNFLAAPDEE